MACLMLTSSELVCCMAADFWVGISAINANANDCEVPVRTGVFARAQRWHTHVDGALEGLQGCSDGLCEKEQLEEAVLANNLRQAE
jgi:hypothetical protein